MTVDIELVRAKRWWQDRPPIGRIDRAARFVGDVGFALLFPKASVNLPSLWEAASDRRLSEAESDWGPDMERVWRWKDDLPRRGLAWYGEFVRGRKSFLSPALLADPIRVRESPETSRITRSPPTPTASRGSCSWTGRSRRPCCVRRSTWRGHAVRNASRRRSRSSLAR